MLSPVENATVTNCSIVREGARYMTLDYYLRQTKEELRENVVQLRQHKQRRDVL